MKQTILVVDDEKEIRDLIEICLNKEGYSVKKAETGEEAIKLVGKQPIDLIILDVMMPNLDGIQVCLRIRKKYNIPIIMLSAKVEDEDKVKGLAVGADDYISKPFSQVELIARVKAHLRRFKELNSSAKNKLKEGNLELDLSSGKVYKRGKELNLTPIEFNILKLLWVNRGSVFKVGEIYESVWGQKYIDNNNTVMVHIRKLREKVEDNPTLPEYIYTVWGVGYKFDNE